MLVKLLFYTAYPQEVAAPLRQEALLVPWRTITMKMMATVRGGGPDVTQMSAILWTPGRGGQNMNRTLKVHYF